MTAYPHLVPVASASWLRQHAAHITEVLRSQGHDEASATTTLAVALIEEAALFSTAYTRWLADPRRVQGEADMFLALAGCTVTAYALAHQLGETLDDWAALKLRHVYADIAKGRA